MDEKPLMLEIMHIHKEWQNYMKKIAQESGIPESYRMIIMFLSRNPGVSQKEVAAFCGTTYAAVSQTIKEMHLTGFIRKETSASDQRYSMLYLTDKGTEYAMKIVEKFKRLIDTGILDPKLAVLCTIKYDTKSGEAEKRCLSRSPCRMRSPSVSWHSA